MASQHSARMGIQYRNKTSPARQCGILADVFHGFDPVVHLMFLDVYHKQYIWDILDQGTLDLKAQFI